MLCSFSTSSCFSSGDIRAYTLPRTSIWWSVSETFGYEDGKGTYTLQGQWGGELHHPAEHVSADGQRIVLPVHDGIGEGRIHLWWQRLGLEATLADIPTT